MLGRRYTIELYGSPRRRFFFILAFTIACLSVFLLPFAVIMLLENLDIVES